MKNVLITGGASGIGKEISLHFAKVGYNVAINYKTSKASSFELVESIRNFGGNAKAFYADITLNDDISKMKSDCINYFGNVDILINNAGISYQRLFCDINEKEWDEIFDVNVKGMFLTTKNFLPQMINNKYGRIINISSILGLTGASCEVHYSSSKAAVIGFTKSLAKEVGLCGITVNSVAPGFIDTPMNKSVEEHIANEISQKTPINRLGNTKDVAAAVLFLASDDASFITGQVLSVDGGLINI